MKKILFKNDIVNIVLGALIIGLILTAFFLGWMTDFFGIIIGILIIIISIKRFFITFKAVSNRDATAVLVIEIIIDLFTGFMLIVYQGSIGLYLGIALYARGFAYLLINYLATRKGNLLQYFIYIGLLTLGSYLMFGGNTYLDVVEIIVLVLILLLGVDFLGFGIYEVVKAAKVKKANAPKKAKAPIKEIPAEVKKTPKEEVIDSPKIVTTTVTKTVVKTEPAKEPVGDVKEPVKTTTTKTPVKTTTTKTAPKTTTTVKKPVTKPVAKPVVKETEKKE